VAIGATNIALFYFRPELFLSAPSPQITDRLDFDDAVSVIEVEYGYVGLTAIHARMRPEVFVDLTIEVLPTASRACPVRGRVPGFVSPVVLAGVLAHAGSAARTPKSAGAIAKRKLDERLGFTAARAGSQFDAGD
jgi:hypothetical protein